MRLGVSDPAELLGPGAAHLRLQHVSLQARALLLRAVGPADGQAVGLPLLLGLASSGTAHGLHGHPSWSHHHHHALELEEKHKARKCLSIQTLRVSVLQINGVKASRKEHHYSALTAVIAWK